MQGFLVMLKAMGLDPEKLKEQAESVVKGIEARFATVETKMERAEHDLSELFSRVQSLEEHTGIETPQEKQPVLLTEQNPANEVTPTNTNGPSNE